MSYTALLRTVPEFLRQPTGIAILASIGIHGLVGLSFPANPPQELEIKRSVKVVQLSPSDQQRIPQLDANKASQQTALLPIPGSPPSLTDLPTFPSVPSGNSNLIPLPGSDGSSSSSPSNIPFTPPPAVPWYWTLPPQPSSIQTPVTTATPVETPLELPTPSSPSSPSPTSENNPSSPLIVQNPALDSLLNLGVATSPLPSPSPTSPSPTSEPSAPSNSVLPDKISAAAIEDLRRLQEQKRAAANYDVNNTSQAEAAGNLNSWYARIQDKDEEALKNIHKLSLSISQSPHKLKGNVAIAVLVNAEGKIVEEPSVIQSSGYKVLNSAAIEKVKNYSFEPSKTGTGKVYFFSIEFKGEVDSTLSAQPSPAS